MDKEIIKNNKFQAILFYLFILACLYLTSLYSYLFFHTTIELTTISIAFTIFIIAWNTRDFSKNSFFLLIGIAFLFISLIDFIHMLSYKGMNIFTGYTANLPTQLWIASRYITAVTFLIAPLILNKKINEKIIFLIYLFLSSLIIFSIFYLKIFPDCYIEGKGLTIFKITSEYIISIILLISAILLFLKKREYNKNVFYYILFSFIITILSELIFTLYISVFDIFNITGHLLKLISFYFIYKAFIEVGLKNPYSILFKMFDEKNKDLEQIINIISHDIMTPIAAIKGFTEEINKSLESIIKILNKKKASSEIKNKVNSIIKNDINEYQNHIKTSINKTRSLLTKLTSLSKLEKIKINHTNIKMNMLINRILDLFSYQINEKKIKVIVDPLPDCKTDELQLNEVFSNIIGNAIKYTDDKKNCKIKISGEKQKNRIIYCIEDNGIGIPEKHHENIFDVFFRIDSNNKNGDGLGLAIVKKIIEKLNGCIYFESEYGLGSKFFISLPYIK